MGLLELLIVIVLIAWIMGGVVMPVGTSLIHLLLVVVLILILFRVLGNRSVP